MLVDMKVSQLHTSNSLVSWYFELSIVICPLLLCHSNLNEVNIRFVIIRNQLDNLYSLILKAVLKNPQIKWYIAYFQTTLLKRY